MINIAGKTEMIVASKTTSTNYAQHTSAKTV